MEEIKKYLKKVLQKFVEFFGGIWQAICLMIALLLVWYLAGISIKYTLPVIVLFFALSEFANIPKARKTLALTLKILVATVLLVSLVTVSFPRVNEKMIVTKALIDQKISHIMGDEVDANAKDRWEVKRDAASKTFFRYYESLLAKGKTQEAADTLAGFKKAWDVKKLQSQTTPPPEISVPVAPPQQQSNTSLSSPTKIDVGNHLLNLKTGEETGWLQIPCNQAYDFDPKEGTFTVYYSDGTVVNSWDGVKWPAKPILRVKNRSEVPITLKVM